jgi:predicted  nucleic acid-binding Zn-ribbon protein
MSQAFHLLQLQKIDTQLDQIQTRLNQIDLILQSNETLQQAEQNHTAAVQAHNAAQLALKQIETTAQNLRIKIETSEAALYSGRIRITKELQDLQNEIQSLKKHQAVLEDQQFQAMIAVEENEALQKNAAQALIKAQGLVADQTASLRGEQSQLLKTQDRLQIERQAVTPQTNAESLAIYARLREQKRGLAVCQVIDDACAICGSVLRPEEKQAARAPNQLVRCRSCGRILYAG